MTDNGSKKKKPKVVTQSPPKMSLSAEKKRTKVTSDTLVKPPPHGKRDKQLVEHMNTFKDWISF